MNASEGFFTPEKVFHLVGIAGIGMSAVAQFLVDQGCQVQGSDRSFDRGEQPRLRQQLARQGISIVPQDGSAIREFGVSFLVTSSAVEETNPDIATAIHAGTLIMSRAELLARAFRQFPMRIAIAGTSGKTTVSSMVAAILEKAGLNPAAIIGGTVRGFESADYPGNFRPGGRDCVCIEADESDGTVRLYEPTIAVVNNIALDHKPIPELEKLFRRFLDRTTEARLVNADCPRLRAVVPTLAPGGAPVRTFGFSPDADIRPRAVQWLDDGVAFVVEDTRFELHLPGLYNVSNALAAIAVCRAAGVEDDVIAAALAEFGGVGRRMEVVSSDSQIVVYDDYAHNPHKIGAAIRALARRHARLLLTFQLHGFGPARLMREELVSVLREVLRKDDVLFLPEIYYVGGTVVRDICAADIAADVLKAGRNAIFVPERDRLPRILAEVAVPGDGIAVMGARDPSLSDLARSIADWIRALHVTRRSA